MLSEINEPAASAIWSKLCAGRVVVKIEPSLVALRDFALLTFDASASPK